MARRYNYIYSNLVENDSDIVGHIAYALYKSDKIEYIKLYKEKHNGAEPDEEDLESFHDISCTNGSLERYIGSAQSILSGFLASTMEQYAHDTEESIRDRHIELLQTQLEPLKPRPLRYCYLHGILQSILGAFLFSLILCAVLFMLKFSDTQYTFTFGGNGNAKIEQNDIKSTSKTNTDKTEEIKSDIQ